eukprot:CAMPEP_0179978510 /NCGR_PEP_ID=MMETSP0983-20121128/40729_1 /TAXON_ID=483367 /ORGANISM="non described non described, Strain CCMP 2436" /LENGTH=102 /DNA_ID=CAMNT_0021895965 /DNA_START=649 /DNA_END=953 /DNA_ORIENTATION=-
MTPLPSSSPPPSLSASPPAARRIDKKCIVDLLVAQVEAAQLIVINKVDMLEPPAANLLAELLQALNPTARIQRTVFARVSLACLIADDRESGGKSGESGKSG